MAESDPAQKMMMMEPGPQTMRPGMMDGGGGGYPPPGMMEGGGGYASLHHTVIVQQQVVSEGPPMMKVGPPGQNTREWSSGLCGCFDDFGTCMFGWCCFECLVFQVTARLQESCCVFYCLRTVGCLAMRTKLRTMYGIRGSICKDWFAITCCPLLTVCQMDRELKHWGY